MELDDITVVTGRSGYRTAQAGPASVFERDVPGIGRFQLRPLRVPADMPTVHAWLRKDYASYWGTVGKSLEEITAEYRDLARSRNVYVGYHQERPAFLVECYEPALSNIAAHYSVLVGDRGMHLLVVPPFVSAPGFTWSVFQYVMDFMFSDAATRRVVVAADVCNEKLHALNRRAGFEYQGLVTLPNKTAPLAICDRAKYAAAVR